jgi:hypothetical protein
MAIDDESRHDLFVLLERDTSHETAAALMRHIPPSGWPDFATKSDIALLKSDIALAKSDIALLGETLRVEMRDQTRRLLFWLVPLMVGALGGAIWAAR